MKQKFRIKLLTNCDKRKRKAMRVAVEAGVTKVNLEGERNNELVLEGEEVDAVCLVRALRKKACNATLETVEKVRPQAAATPQPQPQTSVAQIPSVIYAQPRHDVDRAVYDSYGQTGCLIL